MKLSHKIKKLSARETYDRAARKVRHALSPLSVGALLGGIDQERLRDIQARYGNAPDNYAKYADIRRWLERHIKRVQHLGLDRAAPKSILDLGCGGGFFLYICRRLGHVGQGLDIDELPLLRELVDLLGVRRTTWRIEAFRRLPDLGAKFDLITAFSTRFNRDAEDRRVWAVEEWGFFLDDLTTHLAPGGKIFLEINSGKTRSFYPEELRQLFRDRGAKLERDYVHFAKGIKPR